MFGESGVMLTGGIDSGIQGGVIHLTTEDEEEQHIQMEAEGGFQSIQAAFKAALEVLAAAHQVGLFIQIAADSITDEVSFGDITILLADQQSQAVGHVLSQAEAAADGVEGHHETPGEHIQRQYGRVRGVERWNIARKEQEFFNSITGMRAKITCYAGKEQVIMT